MGKIKTIETEMVTSIVPKWLKHIIVIMMALPMKSMQLKIKPIMILYLLNSKFAMAKTVELVVQAQKLIIEMPFLMLSIDIIRTTVSPKRLNVK